MTDIIQFPNLEQAYLRKAINALSHQQFEEGEALLLKSLDVAYSDEAFMELACVYIFRHKSQSLQQLWDDYYPTFDYRTQSEFLLNLYAQSLPVISSPQNVLLQLYRLKDIANDNEWDTEDLSRIIQHIHNNHDFTTKVQHAIENYQLTDFIEQLTDSHHFNALLQSLKHLYTESVEVFRPFYQELLRHDSIPHYIRSDVLHHLIYQAQEGEVEYLWFGQARTVTIEALRPYNEQPLFIDTVKAIHEYCQQYDPQQFDMLSMHWTMQAMIFYPFIDEVVTEPNEWIAGMLDDEADISPSLRAYLDLVLYEIHWLFELEE